MRSQQFRLVDEQGNEVEQFDMNDLRVLVGGCSHAKYDFGEGQPVHQEYSEMHDRLAEVIENV